MSKNKTKAILIAPVITGLIFTSLFAGVEVKKDFNGQGQYNNIKTLNKSNIADDKKQLIKNVLSDIRAFKESKTSAMTAIKTEAETILTSDNFDAAAYKANNDKIKSLRNEMSDNMTNKISELASKLSAEERKTLMKALDEQWQKMDRFDRINKRPKDGLRKIDNTL